MKKPANFASLLILAAAVSLWAARQAVPAEAPGRVPAGVAVWLALR